MAILPNGFSRFLLSNSLIAWTLSAAPLFASDNVYVANKNSNSVSVINTATETVVASVNVGNEPHGIAVRPDGAFVYVINENDTPADVSVIDTATNLIVATIQVGWDL